MPRTVGERPFPSGGVGLFPDDPQISANRRVTITLTEEGRRAVERKRRLLSEQRRRLFEALAPEERPHAERVLRHLAQIMQEL